MNTLYEALGGSTAVTVAVEEFYRRILVDKRVCHFFDDVDMDRQKAKKRAFLAMVTGGPNRYSGTDMRTAHKPLVERGLDEGHFEIVLEHLGETLMTLGAGEPQVQEVFKLANSVRGDVLNS